MKRKYETGSNHLIRKPFFNQHGDLDLDVPDGDIHEGKKVYQAYCASCHELFTNTAGPKLHNIFGKTAGTQKGFAGYNVMSRGISHQWSKQRLYQLVENPEEVLGIESSMIVSAVADRYERACLIEYLHHLRIHTSPLVKPEWVNKPFE